MSFCLWDVCASEFLLFIFLAGLCRIDLHSLSRLKTPFKFRLEDPHSYAIGKELGIGGCGVVFSAIRSDGLKVTLFS